MIQLNTSEILSLSPNAAADWIATCEAKQLRQLKDAAEQVLSGGYAIVALAGPSCSGKSTTAERLIACLKSAGKNVKVISTDDYFHNLSTYQKTHNGAPDFDHFDCMNKTLLAGILRDIGNGNTVRLSRFDFVTGERTDGVEEYTPKQDSLLILEGIHAFNPRLWGEETRSFKLALNVTESVALDGDKILKAREVRLIRRIIRDEKKRNYRAAQTMNIWSNVSRGEENFIFPFFPQAHVMLSTSLDYEPCIWRDDAIGSLQEIPKENPHYTTAQNLVERICAVPLLPEKLVPQDSILQEFLGNNQN